MIIAFKIIVMATTLFILFCILGMMKMGEDDFMEWLGGKIINAWRWLASHRNS